MNAALRRALEGQREHLAGLDADARAEAVRLVEVAKADLERRLLAQLGTRGGDTWTSRSLGSLVRQAEGALEDLTGALSRDLEARATVQGRAAIDHVIAQVEAAEGPLGGGLRLDLALRLKGKAALRRTGVEKFGVTVVEDVERALQQVLLTRPARQEGIRRLIESGGKAFDGMASRPKLIYRNELAGVYDADAASAQARLAESVRGDPLLARMDEAFDRRSHPFSRVAHGTVAEVGQPWRVPVAAVAAMASALRNGASGIVWPIVGADYTGASYIAHHNDRGRRTCWRAGWGDPLEG